MGMAHDRSLKVLDQVLVLMGLKFAAILCSMDASALLMWHRSFLFFGKLILLVESFIVHPSKTSLDIKTVLEIAIWLSLSWFLLAGV